MLKQSLLVRIALTASALMAASAALAQTSSTPTQSGSMAPAGQGPGTAKGSLDAPGGSTQGRAAVAAQTRQAEAAGKLQPAGEAPDPIGGSASARQPSHKAMTHHRHSKVKHRKKMSNGATRSTGQAPDPMSEPKK